MAKKNPHPYPIVMVAWEDHSSKDGWLDQEQINKDAAADIVIHSVGWLVKEDKKQYALASGVGNGGEFTCVQYILKGTVVKKVVISK